MQIMKYWNQILVEISHVLSLVINNETYCGEMEIDRINMSTFQLQLRKYMTLPVVP